MRDPLVQAHFGIIVEACDHFASDQLRNAATIGGNVCNASPAGDTLPPLLVLDAEVELSSRPNGSIETRRVPLADFFVGPGKTTRAPGELLCAIRLPLPPAGFVGRFFKFGTRPALDISAIAIAVGGVRKDGMLTEARVAFGAVAPVPMRAPKTEAALEGTRARCRGDRADRRRCPRRSAPDRRRARVGLVPARARVQHDEKDARRCRTSVKSVSC